MDKACDTRVLHVITAVGVGGAEHMLLKLLQARALGGFEQRVVALLHGGALAAPMRATGTDVDELDLLGGLPVIGGTFGLARLARAFAPHLVQGWMYHGNLGATVARMAQKRRIPLVWGVRQSLVSLDGENAFARTAIHMNRMLSHVPDRILFNSRTSLDQHRAFGFHDRRAQYLPNGFDTDRFRPDAGARARLRQEWGVPGGATVFGLVARLHPAKDHAGFLRACRHVLAARPEVRFVMAGTGVDRGNPVLTGLIADLALKDRVLCLGERHDVPSIMSAIDVCVSSSTAIEGFSNSVGEAMSCAVPCVVTAVGDSPDVVGDTGVVVPPRECQAMADAMVQLIDLGPQGRRELGARARARVQMRFSLEVVAGRYAELYRELTGHRGEVA